MNFNDNPTKHKFVFKLDTNYKVIGIYKSIKEASNATGLKEGSIKNAIEKKTKLYNQYWSYERPKERT